MVEVTDAETMGWMVRTAREWRGMSREDLAEIIGSDSSTIWRIEHGQRGPSFRLIDAIFMALRVQLRLGAKGPVIIKAEAL